MASMFAGATLFNQDISGWDVSSVEDMNGMFGNTTAFDGDISLWDVSSVEDMTSMFAYATAFNQDISGWNTSAVISMTSMFEGTIAFNQPLNTNGSSWDVSSVTNMNYMFGDTVAFNQDISGWNVSAVTDMNSMFVGATSFNQPLNSWDTSSVTDMGDMFYNATAFNQDISGWDVSSVTNMSRFMEGKTTADYSYYDNLLNAWSQLTLQNGVTWDMNTIEYTSAGAAARQDIIDNYSWTINDGGELEPTLSYEVSYGGFLTQTQINNIVNQSPNIILTRWTGPGYIMSNTTIPSNTTLSQIGNLFTSNFNQSDLIDILVDGAYYSIGGSDNYSPGGYVTLSPYYNGSAGSYFIKWNESAGKFFSARAINQYNPVTGGGQIFNDYEPGDALYNEIDPLTDVIEFSAGLPK
jgi:surface protein